MSRICFLENSNHDLLLLVKNHESVKFIFIQFIFGQSQ